MGNKLGRSKSSYSEGQRAGSISCENKEESSSTKEAGMVCQKVYQVNDKQKAELTSGKRRKSKDMDSLMKEARELFRQGNARFKETKYDEAQSAYRKALENLQVCHDSADEHREMHQAVVLSNLGVIDFAEGRYEDAHQLMQLALEQLEARKGLVIHDTSTVSLTALSLAIKKNRGLQNNDDCVTASELREHASVDSMVADLLNNLAASFEVMGHTEDARKMYEDSMKLRTVVYGAHSLKVAESMQNLATILDQQGQMIEAESLLSRSLEIEIQELGPKHVETAVTMNNLGVLCVHLGMFDRAKDLLTESVSIRREHYGDSHHLTLCATQNLTFVESKITSVPVAAADADDAKEGEEEILLGR